MLYAQWQIQGVALVLTQTLSTAAQMSLLLIPTNDGATYV